MKQLNPKTVYLFFVGFIMRWIIIILILGVYLTVLFSGMQNNTGDVSFSFLNWLWVIIPVWLIVCFVWAKLAYRFYRYELTAAGFRKESGVIYKKYVTIPYDRIQNIDIYRGIWARLLGLSDLQIQTAGSSTVVYRYRMAGTGAEGRLPGLSKEVAEQLRDELVQRAHQSKNLGI